MTNRSLKACLFMQTSASVMLTRLNWTRVAMLQDMTIPTQMSTDNISSIWTCGNIWSKCLRVYMHLIAVYLAGLLLPQHRHTHRHKYTHTQSRMVPNVSEQKILSHLALIPNTTFMVPGTSLNLTRRPEINNKSHLWIPQTFSRTSCQQQNVKCPHVEGKKNTGGSLWLHFLFNTLMV